MSRMTRIEISSQAAQPIWWQRGIIYQIYPRSFQDTDGDGIGDLRGIMMRLDYLADLGVDAVWISPVFPSPMADFGYDVANYCDIDPRFGNLETFDRLVAEMHRRELKIILDYVPNHTSDQHPWFIESRASRASAKRDWYIWRDAKPDGSASSNWLAEFGGSAWQWDRATQQYYYHAFLPQQPDLNWRNPAVLDAMLDVLRFWLDRGVDGFRVDAIHHLYEDIELRDNPINPDWREGMSPARRLLRTHTIEQPEVHDAIAAMRRVADSYGSDRLLIGEAYLPIERLVAYYGSDLSGFHLPFNFHLIRTPWNPTAIFKLVESYEAQLPKGGWPNWVLGNHDRPRLASRIGKAQARVAAMMLLTLRGTPTIYQGEEIGMADVPIPPERVCDPWEFNVPGLGLGRDPERTPMQWDASANAGFSSVEPWLPIAADYQETNVAKQSGDRDSMLSLYRDIIALRRHEPALAIGDYQPVAATEHVLSFERRYGERRIRILLNMSALHQELAPDLSTDGQLLISTLRKREEEDVDIRSLGPNEGVIVQIR
jgi:alpha-glucosidase